MTEVVSQVHGLGLRFAMSGEKLVVRGGKMPAELLEKAKASKDELRAALVYEALRTDGEIELRSSEPLAGDVAMYSRKRGELGWKVILLK